MTDDELLRYSRHILLDEIGAMPLEAQVRLLRVIQHREIEWVGGTDRIPVDIRIIAAHLNLRRRQ